MSETTGCSCPACGAARLGEDQFCESCGARLHPEQSSSEDAEPEACQVCGAAPSAVDSEGYCSVCGARARDARDRIELDLAVAAAVSDRGRVSRRNEDAFHLSVIDSERIAAVVCDGISSASAGDAAAHEATLAAGAVLEAALDVTSEDLSAVALDAVAAAQDAVARVPWTTRADRDTPSCTLVAAMRCGSDVVVASVGDSRAYWLGVDGARQLTVDDSWAQEQIDEGRLARADAHRDPRSHSITHWVGDDAPARPPRLNAFTAPGAGRLVLCTDGLWNYVPDAAKLARLVDGLPEGSSPAAVARALTDTALVRGGRDNITVAVLEFE